MDYNNCCDFGEEIITENGYEYDPDGEQKHDEFNLDEEDIQDFLGGRIDETESINNYVEYHGIPTDEILFQPDIEQLASEGIEQSASNIISDTDIEVVRKTTKQEKEKNEKSKMMTIEAVEIVSEAIDEGTRTVFNTSMQAEKVRDYKNKAVYFKGKFAKAKTEGDNKNKLIFMAIALVAAGIFGGIESNSYYIMQGGRVKSMLSCAFSWIVRFDSMPVRVSPLHTSAFLAGFAFWAALLGLIFLFSWINNDLMKNSRVGHEHGNAKLMNNSSFRKFKNRFMER